MNALVTTSTLGYAEIERLGEAIAKSGLFGLRTKEQAVALMMISLAEGRHPALAARDYHIIQGQAAKKPEAMMRDYLEGGGKVEWHTLDDTKAEATFTHPQGGKVRIGWDMKRAAQAGLGGKDNWKKYPRQMLRSRVVSEGIRTVWPLATSGLYEPGEVSDFAGATIEIEAEAKKPEPDRREQINTEVKLDKPLKKQTFKEWLEEFRRDTEAAQTQDEATPVLDRALAMMEFLETRPAAKAQYEAIRDACIQRLWAEPPEDEGETLDIFGEDKVTAG